MTALVVMTGALLAACRPPGDGRIPIDTAIQDNASRFGIPAVWIESVMAVESGGRACLHGRAIRSRAGAAGVMQLMKPTWTEMQRLFSLGPSIDDPVANIAAGAAYLRLMYDRFGYPGAFAAYNAGPLRYRQSLAGRPLPKETSHYLEKVMARIAGRSANLSGVSASDRATLFMTPGNMKDFGSPGVAGDADSPGGLLFILRR